MLSIVAFLAFALLYANFLFRCGGKLNLDWRTSFLWAALLWALAAVVAVEGLNLVGAFTPLAFAGVWIVVSVVAIWRLNRARPFRFNLPSLQTTTRLEKLLLAGLGVIVAWVGVIAWFSAPNNSDSMTYHVARVMHWIQNQSLHFYPTYTFRQLYLNPAAEYIFLHFHLLSGGDHFDNLVQWFAMLGSIIGVSLVAQELGAARRGQIFAAVFAATLPMGLMEGPSTQNDYVVTFWIVCLVYFILVARRINNFALAFGLGAALGLALLTKATAYIFILPFLVVFGVTQLRTWRGSAFKAFGVAALVALVLVLPHTLRTVQFFGSPFGPGSELENGDNKYTNDVILPQFVVSNLVRNAALHLTTPFPQVNERLRRLYAAIHRRLGVDQNDPRTTWTGVNFSPAPWTTYENTAGNTLHFLLILLAVVLTFFVALQARAWLWTYWLCIALGAVLFAAALRWQPWHSRLHLPLFVLAAAACGVVFAAAKPNILWNLVAVGLVVASLPWLLWNETRPVLGPQNIFVTDPVAQLFIRRPSLYPQFAGAADVVNASGCTRVGLELNIVDWEYPFWILLHAEQNQKVIEHVDVASRTKGLAQTVPYKNFVPCAIIKIDSASAPELDTPYGIFQKQWSSDADPVRGVVSAYVPK